MGVGDSVAAGGEASTGSRDLPEYRARVIEEWIDYNGHLSEAFYVLLFGFATDQVMGELGIGRPSATGNEGVSLYTVEAHIRYLREVQLGAEAVVSSRILAASAKSLHLAHEMYEAGELVATEELLCVYVSGSPAVVTPFPETTREKIAGFVHRGTFPEWVGRSLGVRSG